jgi:hypothetical protein
MLPPACLSYHFGRCALLDDGRLECCNRNFLWFASAPNDRAPTQATLFARARIDPQVVANNNGIWVKSKTRALRHFDLPV